MIELQPIFLSTGVCCHNGTTFMFYIFYINSWENVHHKTTIGVNNIFKEFNNIKLTLNINKNVFVAFSIYNLSIPFNDYIIHSCNTSDLNLKLCDCQK